MPLDDKDPEVKDTKTHLELLYKRKDIVELKKRALHQKHLEIQKRLMEVEAQYNQMVGAISATEELLTKFRDNE